MSVKLIIQDWLSGVQTDLKKEYIRLKLKASGNWARQLEPFVFTEPDRLRAGIKGTKYTEYITLGRRPNQDQTDEGLRKWVGWAGSTFIAEWVKQKNISVNPFAVAWKIAREGWQVPNKFNKGGLIGNVVTRDRVRELNESITLFVVEDFKSEFIKTIKE